MPAEKGVRWSDVPVAVAYACDEAEMAVVQTIKKPSAYEFRLRTIEGYPGELAVWQADDDRIYQATATIGHYGDRTHRAQQLLKAFEHQMRAFGKKRKFDR